MLKKTCLAAVAASLVLVGCSSRDTANESNFSAAINQHFEKDCISVSPRTWGTHFQKYPVTVDLDPKRAKGDVNTLEKEFAALVDAGLLKVTEEKQVKVKDDMASLLRGHKKFKKRTRTTFVPTEKGKQDLSPSDGSAFCAGHYVVDKIHRFTKPAQRMGYTVSHVTFEYSPSDVKPWSKSKEIQAIYKRLQSRLSDHGTSQADLVLTNAGWVHVGDMDN